MAPRGIMGASARATLSAYRPTLRDSAEAWLAEHIPFGDNYLRQDIAHTMTDSPLSPLNWSPVGAVLAADDAGRQMASGHPIAGAAQLALAAIPIPGAPKGPEAAAAERAAEEAARLARAKAMGFRTDMPLYHGTGADFPAFSPEHLGSATRTPTAKIAYWSTRDPTYAAEYAALPASRGQDTGPNVLPLFHRPGKHGQLDLDGSELEPEVAGTIQDAFDAGYDSLLVRQPGVPDKVAVKNPNQYRSVFAKFDPAKRDSSDLLASFGLPAVLGGGAAAAAAMQQPQPPPRGLMGASAR